MAELYGVLDPDTRDWTDGLLSCIFREINKPLPPDKDEARCEEIQGMMIQPVLCTSVGLSFRLNQAEPAACGRVAQL